MFEKGEMMEMQPEGMRRIISSSSSRVYLARLGAGRWMGWIRWPAGGACRLCRLSTISAQASQAIQAPGYTHIGSEGALLPPT